MADWRSRALGALYSAVPAPAPDPTPPPVSGLDVAAPSGSPLPPRGAAALATVLARGELPCALLAAPALLFPGRWTWPALGLLALLWLVRRLALGRWTSPCPLNAPVLLLVALGCLGLVPSADLGTSLVAFYRLLAGAALYFALLHGARSRRAWRRLVWGFWLACLGVATLTLLGTQWAAVRLLSLPALYDHLPAVVRDLETNTSFNPRVMGLALGLLFPLPLAYALWGRERAWRLAAASLVLLLAPVLLLTQSIQAFLGVAAAVLVLAVWRSRWSLLAVALALVVLLAVVLLRGWQPLAAALLSYSDPLGIAVLLRLDIWSRALAMLRAMPWTGIGLDTFPLIQAHFFPGYAIGPEPHAHNLYLQIALDTGLWGLLAFSWLLFAFSRHLVRAYRRVADSDARLWLVGLAACVLSFAVSGLVDTLWAAKPAVLFWVLLGMAAVVSHPGDPQAAAAPRTAARAVWGPVALLFVALPLLTLLLAPGARLLNGGRLLAHRAVVESRFSGAPRSASLVAALQVLERAAARRPADPYTQELLGSLHAWLGEDEAALGAFSRRVALDAGTPLARYAPFIVWQRRVQGLPPPPPWEDALALYGRWISRYPQRAETYVQAALLRARFQGDPVRAQALLDQALAQGARPAELVQDARSRLERGVLP